MNIALLLRADLEAIGIPHTTAAGTYDCHAMRKDCVTWLFERGANESDVQKQIGHKPGSRLTRGVYETKEEESSRRALRSAVGV